MDDCTQGLAWLLAVGFLLTGCGGTEPVGRAPDDSAGQGGTSNQQRTTNNDASGAGGAGSGCNLAYPDPTAPDEHDAYSLESLEQYCSPEPIAGPPCPARIEEAAMLLQANCGSDVGPYLVTGCGRRHVTLRAPTHWVGYIFDEATGELLGAYYLDDVPHEPCDVSDYYGGVAPEPCFEFYPERFGAAGAGNAELLCGASGAGGGASGLE